MTVDSATPTAVNSAIMAAADQILAGLKGGNLFSNMPTAAPAPLPVGHIATSLVSQAKGEEVARCSPTGVVHHQQQEALKAAANSPYGGPNGANCISHSSQVTLEDHNDMNKIASASSLTSSEHSHGESRLMEVAVPPPMQQVVTIGETKKRSISEDSGGPPAQKSRLHQAGHQGHEAAAQAGGQEGPPGTTVAATAQQQSDLQEQQQGAQAPGQTTFQPILAAAPQVASPDLSKQGAPVQAQAPSLVQSPVPAEALAPHQQTNVPLQPLKTHQTAAQETPSTRTVVQGQFVQATLPGQPPAIGAPTAAPVPPLKNVAHEQAPASFSLRPTLVTAPPPPPPQQQHAYYTQVKLPTTAQGQAYVPAQQSYAAEHVPVASATVPAPHANQQHQQQGHPQQAYYSQSYSSTHQGQTIEYIAKNIPIAPAPTPPSDAKQHHQEGYYGQLQESQAQPPTNQAYVAHQPIAPAPPRPDAKGYAQYPHQALALVAPPPAVHYQHQETMYTHVQPPAQSPTTNGQQKMLPPIYPRPCPTLQHHDQKPQVAPQQNAALPQQHPPPIAFGMPSIPRTSQIDTASFQLDHMDHHQQQHQNHSHPTTHQDPSPTATFAAATITHTQHQVLHNNNVTTTNSTLHPPTTGVASTLRRPAFPAPQATIAQPTTTPPPPATQTPPEVASNLRNQRMQPTDCLLFAASLLQETPAPRTAADTPSYPATNEIPGGNPQQASYVQQHQAGVQPQYSVPPQAPGAPQAAPVYRSSPPPTSQQQGDQPRNLDVLCGRGGLINKHIGNIIYRRVVEHNKPFYQSVQKRHRILVSQSIVHTILNRGGRFLSEDTQTTIHEDGTRSTVTMWKPVATARAIQKTSQALRERVANDANKVSSKSDGEEGKEGQQGAINNTAV